MEVAFLRQATRMEEVHSQNQDLAQRLFDLEKLWLAEEQFTAELRGWVEVLQVRWHLWGFCAFTDGRRSGPGLQVYPFRRPRGVHRGTWWFLDRWVS